MTTPQINAGDREDARVEWLRNDLATANIKLREANERLAELAERAETAERRLAEQCDRVAEQLAQANGRSAGLTMRQAFIDAYGEWNAAADGDSNDEESSKAAQAIEAAWQLLEGAKIVRPEDRP
jgi:hypothetical protein